MWRVDWQPFGRPQSTVELKPVGGDAEWKMTRTLCTAMEVESVWQNGCLKKTKVGWCWREYRKLWSLWSMETFGTSREEKLRSNWLTRNMAVKPCMHMHESSIVLWPCITDEVLSELKETFIFPAGQLITSRPETQHHTSFGTTTSSNVTLVVSAARWPMFHSCNRNSATTATHESQHRHSFLSSVIIIRIKMCIFYIRVNAPKQQMQKCLKFIIFL